MTGKLIINIGRQFGSRGREVALELGRRLGIPVYDAELINKAAQESGLSASLFEKRDEKTHFWKIGSVFGSNRYYAGSGGLNDATIFGIQCDTIRKIASEGSAIFIGRASNYALRELDCCLDVFIHAPLEVRAKYVALREGISEEEAGKLAYDKDTARAQHYNLFTDGHWGKSSDYDMCIDSSLAGVEGTADIIIEFGRKAGLID